MKDKVANVFLSSLALFQTTVGTFSSTNSGRDLQGASESLLPTLIEKLGDNNARIRYVACPC